jgi:hypothetical protein
MRIKRIILIILICLLILPINVFAISYAKVGADGDFNGDINIPSGCKYYINGTALAVGDITGALANMVEDTTPQLGGNLDLNTFNISLTAALGSDHTYSGLTDSQPVGESVVFGQLLYFNWTDKEWKIADADASATMPGLRIALETKADGQTCLMLVKGYIRDDSAFEFTGAMVYASQTTGTMTSTAPSTAGNQVQRVGVAKSADVLFFNPSIDVGEI